jgi:N-acetyl-anhydromuramyl-L-alanine amidase AmpD
MIPHDWLSKVKMKRIVTHWTAGGYIPRNDELRAYHILIDGNGRLHRGTYSIADNARDVTTAGGHYAQHVHRANSWAIGVTVCAMSGATSKTRLGESPMTRRQWEKMIAVTSELCTFYRIPINDKTVLGHGEVATKLGIYQAGRVDPLILPWDKEKSFSQVGDLFRERVRQFQKWGF